MYYYLCHVRDLLRNTVPSPFPPPFLVIAVVAKSVILPSERCRKEKGAPQVGTQHHVHAHVKPQHPTAISCGRVHSPRRHEPASALSTATIAASSPSLTTCYPYPATTTFDLSPKIELASNKKRPQSSTKCEPFQAIL
ncbi:hypothetical protein GGP41_008848 [Bipolaris sorokiniana]|uniref:Uncharacterized protein n=1 Tax=Cochliobolus sativus TaxID=45130 RepID=A0A8H5Z7C5_COCSA|nr:hypothetical protein GGP41_008848 [Bipolaris sorokiniana]